MQIINYFDLKFILNLSISISISLFVVFILGKAITDSFSESITFLLNSFVKTLIKRFLPIKFKVGFPDNKISANKISYKKDKVIDFGKLKQTSLPAVGMDIFVKPETKFPFLYDASKIRVQLVDYSDFLKIYNPPNKLPGKLTVYAIAEFEFENNIVNYIHIDFKPEHLFDKYDLKIIIFFQGKLYCQDILQLTVTKEQ